MSELLLRKSLFPMCFRSSSDSVSATAREPVQEAPDYLSRQLITYLGNKRSLLPQLSEAVERVKARLGKDKLEVFDAFSGSGVVSRMLKAHASRLISNDLEEYAAVIGRCFLRNHSEVDWTALQDIVDALNQRVEEVEAKRRRLAAKAARRVRARDGTQQIGGTGQAPNGQELGGTGQAPNGQELGGTGQAPNGQEVELEPGFIEELYAPQDDEHIQAGERVFYTRSNARRLDNYRRLIASAPTELQDLLLGPLLSAASIHANTAGVFKGFYKNRHTGVGQFGGTGRDALERIRAQISLQVPVSSRFECLVEVRREDANTLAPSLRGLDLAYLDPPYNQHPYGSNYFMLNLLTRYQRPSVLSPVSGIPHDWQRSDYNVRKRHAALLTQLLDALDAPFVLLSFNNEGFIPPARIQELLSARGKVEVIRTPYNAFRGSRSFERRPIHVTECMYLLEKH
ncbi:MAG: DNA adenine methylase [Myxococcota bacterium]|jgi:adenine-specific DNA-methyltransferase|nr:DNA adenine methylase [Myxococcota bacterium]